MIQMLHDGKTLQENFARAPPNSGSEPVPNSSIKKNMVFGQFFTEVVHVL
jgi:hypothetical protein